MLKRIGKEFLAVLLCILVANPPTISAASAASVAAPRNVLGSIAVNGPVQIGDVAVPAAGTLFSGDRVKTNDGSAVIQYKAGARVVLASGSQADFASARVQLEKGLMTFQTASANGLVFAASTLRLEPTGTKTAANITLNNRKASVAVTEGSLKVVDPSGVQLASLSAGDARLFEEAPASLDPPASPAAPAPAPAAAAPPQGLGNNGKWVLAIGLGVIGLSLGVAGIVRAGDASDKATAAQTSATAAQTAATAAQTTATAAQSAAAAAQAQVTAANALIVTLTARVNANTASSASLAAIAADLAKQNALLAQVQADLAAGRITPAQASAQLTTIIAALNGDGNKFTACINAASGSGVC